MIGRSISSCGAEIEAALRFDDLGPSPAKLLADSLTVIPATLVGRESGVSAMLGSECLSGRAGVPVR